VSDQEYNLQQLRTN